MNRKRTCSSCKYWAIPSDSVPADFRYCDLTEADDGQPKYRDSLAVSADAEDYWSCLRTHALFYCCQWKARS
jgi:hypothetical protein